MKRPTSPAKAPSGLNQSEKDRMALWAPCLTDHLTDATWDEGQSRKTSTLLIFSEDGRWKACLKDRERNMSLWASGDCLEDTLLSLEAMLDSGTGEWRQSRPS